MMTTAPLDALTAAWEASCTLDNAPSLESLRAHGAPLDHAGFALLGQVSQSRRGKTTTSFKVIEAGPDHLLLGGHRMQGHRIDEIVHPAHVARLNELYASIVATQKPHKWRCVNMARNAEPISYTRVLVPVRDDVGDGRCLAGVWVWHTGSLSHEQTSAA